jgi:L-threonylcarbamoyladenylate synthase
MHADEAANFLNQGGVVIYPTETLYALGCAAKSAEACARVARLKARPLAKPFPLVLGSVDELWAVAGAMPAALLADLELVARHFWPGPLSVLLPTRPGLPDLVRDATGHSSVRISPHPTVQRLCALIGGPLVATSANISGQPATARPEELDPALLSGVDAALLGEPLPGGGQPSTLIRLLGGGAAQVLRAGAIPLEALASHFELLAPGGGAPQHRPGEKL